MIIIGIDPGITGAIAAIEDGRVIGLSDMPVMAKIHGKGQEVETYELASIIQNMRSGKPAEVYLEQVGNRPSRRKPVAGKPAEQQCGSGSMFGFGDSFGCIRGVCGALQLKIVRVTPQTWKKYSGLIGKEKDASRTLAIQQHPEISDMLTRKKDCGRADAVMIAVYGARCGR